MMMVGEKEGKKEINTSGMKMLKNGEAEGGQNQNNIMI